MRGWRPCLDAGIPCHHVTEAVSRSPVSLCGSSGTGLRDMYGTDSDARFHLCVQLREMYGTGEKWTLLRQSGDPRVRDHMHVYTVRRPPGT
jgi:hypothetical protein